MHPSVLAWVGTELTRADIVGRSVLEVGSYNVNGSVRPFVLDRQPASYLGVDAAAGPDVDRVVDCENLETDLGTGVFDVVISTEMLEHARHWQACLYNMAAVLKPGGLLIVTTRSPGFPFHPFPDDHWRFTARVMAKALTAVGCGSFEISHDPEAPGVFVKARKSAPWNADRDALAALEAEPIIR